MQEYKKQQFDNICAPCGITANYLTCLARYGTPPKQAAFSVSTFHKGKCDVCKRMVHVTEARDFFFPDFKMFMDYVALIKKRRHDRIYQKEKRKRLIGYKTKEFNEY